MMADLTQEELDRREKEAADRRKRVQWQASEMETAPSKDTQ